MAALRPASFSPARSRPRTPRRNDSSIALRRANGIETRGARGWRRRPDQCTFNNRQDANKQALSLLSSNRAKAVPPPQRQQVDFGRRWLQGRAAPTPQRRRGERPTQRTQAAGAGGQRRSRAVGLTAGRRAAGQQAMQAGRAGRQRRQGRQWLGCRRGGGPFGHLSSHHAHHPGRPPPPRPGRLDGHPHRWRRCRLPT